MHNLINTFSLNLQHLLLKNKLFGNECVSSITHPQYGAPDPFPPMYQAGDTLDNGALSAAETEGHVCVDHCAHHTWSGYE
jgi:hypothetical protein